MISDNNELLLEVWSRIKPFIPTKERLEAADAYLGIFDEFGLADNLENEDLDKELRAAHVNLFGETEITDEDGEFDDEY
jgi:hypothetical protein